MERIITLRVAKYLGLICLILNAFGVTHSHMYGSNNPKKCHDVCPVVYRVVCALDVLDGCFRTFASSCVMRMYNCKYQKGYKIIAERACEFITNDDLRKLEL